MMNIELFRIRCKSEAIDGQIWIDDQRICDCAENAHHCLPEGTYQITVGKCRVLARKMPIVTSPSCPPCSSCRRKPFASINTSTPRRCVQLRPGNGVYHRTDGSIIVGEYLAPGCLKHPRSTFDNLFDRIRKAAERGHDITLTIRWIH